MPLHRLFHIILFIVAFSYITNCPKARSLVHQRVDVIITNCGAAEMFHNGVKQHPGFSSFKTAGSVARDTHHKTVIHETAGLFARATRVSNLTHIITQRLIL